MCLAVHEDWLSNQSFASTVRISEAVSYPFLWRLKVLVIPPLTWHRMKIFGF